MCNFEKLWIVLYSFFWFKSCYVRACIHKGDCGCKSNLQIYLGGCFTFLHVKAEHKVADHDETQNAGPTFIWNVLGVDGPG